MTGEFRQISAYAKQAAMSRLIQSLLSLFVCGNCLLPGKAQAQAEPKYEPYSFTTIAGTTRLYYPSGIAVDSAGNVYVADSENAIIRKITPDGQVSTLAGSNGRKLAPGNNDGIGTAAGFGVPRGMAIDSAGNLYVADQFLHTVRKITPTGVVTTLAGGAGSAVQIAPQAVAVDHLGNVYVADFGNEAVRKITPAGLVTTLADSIDNPTGIAVDSAGNVYVAEASPKPIIVKITPNGTVSTLAGGAIGDNDGTGTAAGFYSIKGVAVDSAGNVYVADYGGRKIRKITPGGVVTTLAGGNGEFTGPWGIAVDSAGYVYVADHGCCDSTYPYTRSSTIRKVSPGGVVTTLVSASLSDDGIRSIARFDHPKGLAIDSAGTIYVADTSNSTIRKITSAGVVTTLAGLARDFDSQDGAGSVARFFLPIGIAVDNVGNIYVADSENNTIRKITPGGVVSTLAGLAGDLGNEDGTGSAARFYQPEGVAVDSAGNVYVADSYNDRIRKITPSRVVTTLAGSTNGYADGTGSAAQFDLPTGVAVDSSGNVYVADQFNNTIRKVTSGGVVSTLVPRGTFLRPSSVAVDGAGNVYVADKENERIGKITPGGVVSILGGVYSFVHHAGDDGIGSLARFGYPYGIAVDMAGNVYVADTENEMIRRGAPPPVGQLLNISTRLRVNTGDNVLIGGFKISGNANRQVLVRALGPTLHGFGINDALADPILELHDGNGTLLTTNDNWKDTQQAAITPTGKAPPNDLESAILRTLPPGNYTAIVRGKNNASGVGLVEAYAVDQAVTARLTNLSTRGFVDVNQNVMIGGFITGNDVNVIVRALGPTLSQYSVPNVLADPTLELRDQNGTLITSNDNWADNQLYEIEATGFAPPHTSESAVLITRPAGNTTAIVRGKNNATGNALVEVYSLN